MNNKWLVVVLTLIGCSGATVLAQLSAADRAAVEHYRAALQSAEAGSPLQGLEGAFSAFGPMQEALMRVPDGQTATVVESLSDEKFDRLERDVPSALINREEVVFVRPDPDYFVKLAAVRGDEADRAFFTSQGHVPGWCLAVVRRATDRLQRLHAFRKHEPG